MFMCCLSERLLSDNWASNLTDFGAMQEAGIVGVSDDGVGVQSSFMMKQAMVEGKGTWIASYCPL